MSEMKPKGLIRASTMQKTAWNAKYVKNTESARKRLSLPCSSYRESQKEAGVMLRKPSLNKSATHTYCEEYTFPPQTPQKKR